MIAKKIPVKGKRYSRSFAFDRNFTGSVIDPSPPNWWFGLLVADDRITEYHVFVQSLGAGLDESQRL